MCLDITQRSEAAHQPVTATVPPLTKAPHYQAREGPGAQTHGQIVALWCVCVYAHSAA